MTDKGTVNLCNSKTRSLDLAIIFQLTENETENELPSVEWK